MNRYIRLFLSIFAAYRLASMLSSEEGPYLGLWKDERQTGVFEWIRFRLGAEDYGLDGLAETNLGRGISCPLCTGVYISAALVALVFLPTKIGDYVLAWLGVSGAQTFLANLTSDDAVSEAIEEVADSLEE